MSRQFFGVEKGFDIYLENSDTFVRYIIGVAAPDGLGDQATAPIGSLYQRIGVGELYQKIANAGSAADWELNGSGSSSATPIFRNIVTRAATGDVLAAGSVDPSSFSDNDDGLDGLDYAIGEYLIGGVGGTPILFEVTAVTSASDITIAAAAPALADNDGFIVRTYHPDPAGQENTAGVMYQNGNIIKLFDVDWSSAVAITLSSGYSAQNGTPTIGDSVEVAIEKLDGNQQDLTTLTGVAQGSTDLGTFTGNILGDTETIKSAFQTMETFVEEVDQNVDDLITLSGRPENSVDHGAMTGGDILSDSETTNGLFLEIDAELTRQRGKSSAAGVTTATVVDQVIVDDVSSVLWMVTIENAAAPVNKRHIIVHAGHDGHAAADAVNSDDTEFAKLKQGSNFNYTVSVILNGAAGAQEMRLSVASTEPSGVNVYAKRIENLF